MAHNTIDNSTFVTLIKEVFPEFTQSKYYFEIFPEDGPYTFTSYFGEFLLEDLDRDTSITAQKFFLFLNDLFFEKKVGHELWDMINLELFSRLSEKERYKKVANKMLFGEALRAFVYRDNRP